MDELAPNWKQEQERQRVEMLNVLLAILAVAGAVAVWPSFRAIVAHPRRLDWEPWFILAYGLSLWVWLDRRLPYAFRLSVPVVACYAVGTALIYIDGVGSFGVWYLFIPPLLLFSLGGGRMGIAAVVLSLLIFGGFAAAHYLGWLEILEVVDVRQPKHLQDVVTSFLMVMTMVGVAQGLFNFYRERAVKAVYAYARRLEEARDQLHQHAARLGEVNARLAHQSRLLQVAADLLQDVLGVDDVDFFFNLLAEQFYRKLRGQGVMYVGVFLQEIEGGGEERERAAALASLVEERAMTLRAFGGREEFLERMRDVPPPVLEAARSGTVHVAEAEVAGERVWEFVLPLRTPVVMRQSPVRFAGAVYICAAPRTELRDVDKTVWRSLAGQFSVVVQNVALFRQARMRLEEMEARQRRYTRRVWRNLFRMGAVFTHGTLPEPWMKAGREVAIEAVRRNQLVVENEVEEAPASLAVPIKMRDEVIGVVTIQSATPGQPWTREQLALVEAVVERLGAALDSARLYQDSQRRAEREQITGNVAAAMRASLDVDAVLQAAVQEIGAALRLHDLTIRLESRHG